MTETTETTESQAPEGSAMSQLGDNPTPQEEVGAMLADGMITQEQANEALADAGQPSAQPSSSDPSASGGEGEGDGRPDFLREEFKTPEDQARAYNDLVKLLGKQGKLDEGGNPIKPKGEGESDEGPAIIGRDQLQSWSEEFAANGALGDDTYSRLEKAGFDRDTVNTIAAALQTADSVGKAAAIQEAGIDPASFQAMTQWAGEAWSEGEINAFNSDYLGADEGRRLLALKSLKNEYAAANGQGPGGTGSGVIEGQGGDEGTLRPFRSEAEFLEAQQVKDARGRYRYDTDPAYRDEVDRRAAAALHG